MVSERRRYYVTTIAQAKEIVKEYFKQIDLNQKKINFGLPEIHDRYDIWKVPILFDKELVGDITIDAFSGEINKKMSSDISILEARISTIKNRKNLQGKQKRIKFQYIVSELKNTIALGRSEQVLQKLPDSSER